MNNYIVDFLKNNNHIGAENGIKTKDLLAALGRNISSDSERYLREEIHRCRTNWHEIDGIENYIVSDTKNGYYIPKNNIEVMKFFFRQDKMGKCHFITVKGIRKYLKKIHLI